MSSLIIVAGISFGMVALITPLMGKLAIKINMVDHPSERKIHRKPIPLLGGLAIYLGFLPGVLSTLDYHPHLVGVLIGGSIIMLTGIIDDKYHLPALPKLLIQIIASLILLKYGIVIKAIPHPLVAGLVTIFGVVGITNAINFLDNMDGLAAGLTAIGCYSFFIISQLTGQKFLGYLTLSLGTSCVAFLLYNFKPAKIFMGDAGSTFLGFNLAALAIMGSWAYNVFVAITVPVLVLAIPIFDTTLITILRIKEGKVRNLKQWLEHTDLDHLSHRLAGLGVGEKGAVLIIYAIAAFLGGLAIVVQTIENTLFTVSVWLFLGALSLWGVRFLSRYRFPK